MNKELESKALEIITQMQDAIKAGAGEVPRIAYDYLIYSQISSLFWGIFNFIILLAIVFFGFRRRRMIMEFDDLSIVLSSFLVILFVIFFCSFINYLDAFLFSYFSPGVFLLKSIVGVFK